LRKFVAITAGGDVSTKDPHLKAKDMARRVISFNGAFPGSDTKSDMNHGGSKLEESEEEMEYHHRPKWACLGLEVLCLKIEISARPDTRLDVINSPDWYIWETLYFNKVDQSSNAQGKLDRQALEA